MDSTSSSTVHGLSGNARPYAATVAIAVIVPNTVLAIRPSTPTRCAAVREIRVCPGAVILGRTLSVPSPRNIVPSG